MILVLLLAYVGILFLAVKFKLIKLTLFWKLSPIIWVVFLLVVLFIPLQFWAPAGYVRVLLPTVQIVPNVAGQVTEILVEANQPVKEGDVLFKIDPEPFESAVEKLEADLILNQTLLEQQLELDKKKLGRKLDLDRARSRVEVTTAQLKGARYNLEHTVVVAPGNGIVTNVDALRVGARVVSAPITQTMAFVENGEAVLLAQVQQIYMRLIEAGQPVEVTFKMYPGQIYNATVVAITPGSSIGQIGPTGALPTAINETHGPLFVRLKLDDQQLAASLPAGATGEVAIYSPDGKPAHIIRKVMIRLSAIKNYIVPF